MNTDRKHNRIFLALTLLVLTALLCAACGGGGGDEPPVTTDPIVRTDALGLVTVTITGGEAVVTYHPERWEDFADETLVYETAEVYAPSDAPFPVNTINGKIKDVIVEQIEAFSFNHMSDFVLPSLVLLIEDGSVELAMPSPFLLYPGYDEIDSYLVLPIPETVVALSAEPIGEGVGGTTVIAETESGLHYDLRHVYRYRALDDGVWASHNLGEGSEHKAWLWFGEDGRASLIKRHLYDEDWSAVYAGTYMMHLDEEMSRGLMPGMLSLELALVDAEGGALDEALPERIEGSYFLDYYGAQGWLDLYLSDGDALHDIGGVPVTHCGFWREDI